MKKLGFGVIVVLLLVAFISVGVSASDMVDGYMWDTFNRDQKAGVLVGTASTTTYFAEMMGTEGYTFTMKQARTISYMIDDWYGEQFPKHYNLVDVILEGSSEL